MSGARAGRTCAKHNQWCPDDVCRWCEPPLVIHVSVRSMVLPEDIVKFLRSDNFREAIAKTKEQRDG